MKRIVEKGNVLVLEALSVRQQNSARRIKERLQKEASKFAACVSVANDAEYENSKKVCDNFLQNEAPKLQDYLKQREKSKCV